nr:monovalent cation/H(+) antiporter subunit G [Bacillus kwashiorkori]
MSESAEVIAAIFIFLGTVVSLISSVGNLRLPDVYTRAHAASKSTTLGVMGVLIGTLLYFLISESFFSIRLILGMLFVFLTAPVSSHMVIRSAYRAQVPLAEISVQDELKNYFGNGKKEVGKN